ncbi:LysR substrate-binding domain-containing protein, partial [Sphingomonas bacterium]|uniref:LysR substrate-binding domain-containing protein n=1 Tax=Sphingomonas bacterium TaxID=1895847 RepID=UPI0020C5C7AC
HKACGTTHIVHRDLMKIPATAAEAPGVTLAFRGWGSGAAALADVASGVADIAVSVFRPGPPRGVLVEHIVDEQYRLAGRAGHPALADEAARGWLDYPHIIVSAEGATRTEVDDRLTATGLERRVGLAVPSFLLVPDLLRASQMLALLPSLVLTGDRAAGLATAPPPIVVDGFRIDMATHERHRADLAVAFVATSIRSILQDSREKHGADQG